MPRLDSQGKRLTPKQKQEFVDALVDAFTSPEDLDQMLQLKLGKRLADLSLASNLPIVAFELINQAEAQAWSRRCLRQFSLRTRTTQRSRRFRSTSS